METREELEYAIAEITEIAKGHGLDFYPMRYEVCPAEIIYTFGAYGMPSRFTHWSFGKQFHKMKLYYDLGLSQIYELVINSDPCYAFLLDSNSLIQNKLIIAHVLAHSDFFKNNIYFSNTRQDMVESMATTSDRIARFEQQHGKEPVERFLDAVLSIQEHIDPTLTNLRNSQTQEVEDEAKTGVNRKDLLLFIAENGHYLEDWQRDIVMMMREEMLYFWPQLQTKIMNEGWASYWHQKILRQMNLTTEETIEFAKLHASVIQPSRTHLNPYYLGLKLLEDIEKRYDHPTELMKEQGVTPHSGLEKLFQIREQESDVAFIRNYMTKEFMTSEDLYIFQKQGEHYVISDQEYDAILQQLLQDRINGGFPTIFIEDGDYLRNGELYLQHQYEGMELDVPYLEKVLLYLFQLWGRTVHLETVIDGDHTVFSYNGTKHLKRAVYH